jgi:hypothetical protein
MEDLYCDAVTQKQVYLLLVLLNLCLCCSKLGLHQCLLSTKLLLHGQLHLLLISKLHLLHRTRQSEEICLSIDLSFLL